MKPKAYRELPFLDDPKREAEDERLQEILRASHGRGRLTEEERTVSRGAAEEEIARANLARMQAARKAGKRRRRQGGATLDMIAGEQARLADALKAQGRFRDAARCHPSKRRARDYEKMADAVETDDALCACPRDRERDPASGREVEISPRHVVDMVFSEKHGRVVPLYECRKCGARNATPEEGQGLMVARNAEASARAKGVGAVPDVRLLGVRS